MTVIHNVPPATEDEVIYDPERERATHLESGLTVEFVGFGRPQDRETFFKLIVKGREIPFTAIKDAGEDKIRTQYPNLGINARADLVRQLRERNYHASNINRNFDREIFVKVWRRAAIFEGTSRRISTYYTDMPLSNPDRAEKWSCEG